jgi:hypothetical protein
MSSVFANGRSILHKGHGMTQLAIAPDVCKTPSPGGPVPIPYPNLSSDSNLTKGVATVKIEGNPLANVDSQLSRSNGDEAGTAGGVVSSKNMGAFGWPAGSIDVMADGKGVVRLLDSCLTNGNAYNDTGVDLGKPQLGYADDAKCPREDCKLGHDLAKHRIPETDAIAQACADFVKEAEKLGGKKGPYGRMIGVGMCEHPQLFKAVSGAPMSPVTSAGVSSGPGAGSVGGVAMNAVLSNTVSARPGDAFFTAVLKENPRWECAALKILSNAGHLFVALSEKWVGSEIPADKQAKNKGRTRYAKFMLQAQKVIFPVVAPGGEAVMREIEDKIPGSPGDEIEHGGSVPSCGRCQALLPSLACEMTPCKDAK